MKLLLAALLVACQALLQREPDVPYEPTPHVVVQRMLELAAVARGTWCTTTAAATAAS